MQQLDNNTCYIRILFILGLFSWSESSVMSFSAADSTLQPAHGRSSSGSIVCFQEAPAKQWNKKVDSLIKEKLNITGRSTLIN